MREDIAQPQFDVLWMQALSGHYHQPSDLLQWNKGIWQQRVVQIDMQVLAGRCCQSSDLLRWNKGIRQWEDAHRYMQILAIC